MESKKNNLLIYILGVIVFALVLIGIYLLFQNFQLKKKIVESGENLKKTENEVKAKEEEILSCIEGNGEFVSSSQSDYSFSDFGIYSPYFENKTVDNGIFNYRRSKIIDKTIGFENWQVDVWELERETGNGLRLLYNKSWSTSAFDFPIFIGYENYLLNPTFISELLSGFLNSKDFYVNKNNIKMYWNYYYAPKQIASVGLEFYLPFSPSGNQIYVILSAQSKTWVDKSSDPALNVTKDFLKQIADTISAEKE